VRCQRCFDEIHLRPVLWGGRPAPGDELGHRLRPVFSQLWPRPLLEHLDGEFLGRFHLPVRFLERTDLPEQHAEGEDISGETISQVKTHFRGHVTRSAASVVEEGQAIFCPRRRNAPPRTATSGAAAVRGGRSGWCVEADGKTEIKQLQHPGRVEADVRRLQIPEENPVGVQETEGIGDGAGHLDLAQRRRRLPVEGILPAFDAVFKSV